MYHNSFNGCNKIGRTDESLTITQLVIPDSVVAIRMICVLPM